MNVQVLEAPSGIEVDVAGCIRRQTKVEAVVLLADRVVVHEEERSRRNRLHLFRRYIGGARGAGCRRHQKSSERSSVPFILAPKELQTVAFFVCEKPKQRHSRIAALGDAIRDATGVRCIQAGPDFREVTGKWRARRDSNS
ncbi:MAG TPA: hypothetical protein VGM85_14190 [Paraburkholderia sp.]